MSRTIGKWGNSLALRIPRAFTEQLHWDENTEVECQIVDGRLVVVPVTGPVYDLDSLVAGITVENRHAEIGTGPATGQEVW